MSSASPSPSRSGSALAAEVVRTPGWIAALVALVGVLVFVYAALFRYCYGEWLKPDYSHGFLVPFFAAYLAWRWRAWAPERVRWPEPWGLAFLAVGGGLFVVFGDRNVGKEWMQGLSFVLNLCGVTLLLGGWKALKWLWPALAFLLFMFPLPWRVEHALGWQLQKVASIASEFVLQTIGYPTYREGIILHVKDHVLRVEEACSGLSMLLTFAALATGMAVLVQRPWLDRGLILVSAVPVAVLSNVLRIALTGVLYNEAGKELGDRVFHDFAGWMMMPLALAVLWGELKLLDWVFVDEGGKASREEMLKMNSANPAYLIMTAPAPGKGSTRAPAALPTAAQPAKPAAVPQPAPSEGASR
ncbi:Transmembrane exosortase [Gemmata sp. SH-PL17]|uniref:exosortase/archaeosortase family protein n=1 Tax=Gemmata sp. SH-PL17 TaxID=1630693 RepID=UPI00078BD426|nr:exosortase/archaeosortase family protein [Gemmata sp. SH-PL17]AMV23583.1 Transmembrane exosortase [Gemmata sp. SH-PL17]